MRKFAIILWGVLSTMPVVYLVYFVNHVFSAASAPLPYEEQRSEFDTFFRLHLTVIVSSWVLIASYIMYLFRTSHVPNDKKALWGIVIFLGSFIAMPIFWFLYVWKPYSMTITESSER